MRKVIRFFYRYIKYVFLKMITLRTYLKLSKKNIINELDEISLMITHNMGGGTEQYVTNFIKENKDTNLLILRNFSYWNDIFYILENPKTGDKYCIKEISNFLSMFKNIQTIYLNSLFSFYKWESIIDYLKDYKKQNPNVRLEYFLHDFHCICPGTNLISEKKFCNLDCTRNKCTFNKFTYTDYKSISYWQTKWEDFLICCDNIRVFDQSGKDILQSKYKKISDNKIQLIPHSMDYCILKPIDTQKKELVIGVIGSVIGIPKGENVLKELIIEAQKQNIKVVVIGKYRKKVKASNVFYTGEYTLSNLQNIILQNGINIACFTSIWPETFSYLVSELTFLNIPIVAFNIGAQGRKVQNYKKGYLCNVMTGMEMLNVTKKAFSDIYNGYWKA